MRKLSLPTLIVSLAGSVPWFALGASITQPVPSAPQTPTMVVSSPAPVASVDYKKFRDPFKEPAVTEVLELRSDLERYAVTDFKVQAIITGPLRMRAMLLAPDNKTHFVSEKMKIGLRDGVIVKITTKTIVVREKVVNPLGDVETFETEIGMDQPAVAGAPTQ